MCGISLEDGKAWVLVRRVHRALGRMLWAYHDKADGKGLVVAGNRIFFVVTGE